MCIFMYIIQDKVILSFHFFKHCNTFQICWIYFARGFLLVQWATSDTRYCPMASGDVPQCFTKPLPVRSKAKTIFSARKQPLPLCESTIRRPWNSHDCSVSLAATIIYISSSPLSSSVAFMEVYLTELAHLLTDKRVSFNSLCLKHLLFFIQSVQYIWSVAA